MKHVSLVFFALASVAGAQCPDWVDEFTPGHADKAIRAAAVFDDGGGPALYLGGDFDRIGSTSVHGVARYDGANIVQVGGGIDGALTALTVIDLGTGPQLYATGLITPVGGTQTSVARLDGSTWTSLGAGIPGANNSGPTSATCIAKYDDGTGPALYVGGSFAGGLLGNGECVRRWNGSSWVTLGSDGPGAHPFFLTPSIETLAVFDDGTGSKLYAGGRFLVVSGSIGSGVARWNGSVWETVTLGTGQTQSGVDANVTSLAVHDFGAGPTLFAAGSFTAFGSEEHVARLVGGTWVVDANGPNAHVTRLRSIVGGGLHIVGSFTAIGGGLAEGIGRFDGVSFHAIGTTNPLGGITDVASFDSGVGARLFATCDFGLQSLGAFGVFDGSAWTLLEVGNVPQGNLNATASFDDDQDGRNSLFVGGVFSLTSSTQTFGLARYDRGSWSNPAPSLSLGQVSGFDVVMESGAPTLYAAGQFQEQGAPTGTSILRYDGTAWSGVGVYFGVALSVARFDPGTGEKLWAGHPSGLRAWDGSTWTQPFAVTGGVGDLVVFDDGGGPALFGVGVFGFAGGVPVKSLFRWDGTNVDALIGSGSWKLTGANCMCVHDDGNGPKLYVAGNFSNGGAPAQVAITRRDGSTWTPIATSFTLPGSGLGFTVRTLGVHQGANGAVLVAGGPFTSIDGVPSPRIAQFDGSSWSAFGSGLSSSTTANTYAVTDHDFGDGSGPDLIVAGLFQSAGGTLAANLARYRGCGAASAFCFGDGSGTACPCGNVGALGHGCGTAGVASGALLSLIGRAQVSSDTASLIATGIAAGAPMLFYEGTAQVNGGLGVPFGDGLSCVSGTLIRLGIRFSVNGSASFGGTSGPAPLSILGLVPGAGAIRHYGCRYRGDLASCTFTGFSFTNALSIAWAP